MPSSQDARPILLEHAPNGQWLCARDLYEVVAAHAEFDDTDPVLIAGKSSSTRCHRAVRNAMQRHKRRREVEWQPGVGFRFGSERPAPATSWLIYLGGAARRFGCGFVHSRRLSSRSGLTLSGPYVDERGIGRIVGQLPSERVLVGRDE